MMCSHYTRLSQVCCTYRSRYGDSVTKVSLRVSVQKGTGQHSDTLVHNMQLSASSENKEYCLEDRTSHHASLHGVLFWQFKFVLFRTQLCRAVSNNTFKLVMGFTLSNFHSHRRWSAAHSNS